MATITRGTAQRTVSAEDGAERRSVPFDGPRVTGIVLAGGHSWLRSSLDALGPRALLPLADRPLVGHALGWLTHPLVCDTVLCTNGASRLLEESLARCPHVPAFQILDDAPARGPAGCAADVASACGSETVVVVDGSTIPTIDLADLVGHHRAAGASATIVVQPRGATLPEGARSEVPAGIYVFQTRALAGIPSAGFHDIKEGLLRRLYQARELVQTYEASSACPRVIDTRSYLHVSRWAVTRLCHTKNVMVLADPSARVEDGALVIGPVVLSTHTVLMARAAVVGPALIGSQTVVHPDAIVSRSIIGSGCVIGAGAFVDQTVIVDGTQIPANARLIEALRAPLAVGSRGSARFAQRRLHKGD